MKTMFKALVYSGLAACVLLVAIAMIAGCPNRASAQTLSRSPWEFGIIGQKFTLDGGKNPDQRWYPGDDENFDRGSMGGFALTYRRNVLAFGLDVMPFGRHFSDLESEKYTIRVNDQQVNARVEFAPFGNNHFAAPLIGVTAGLFRYDDQIVDWRTSQWTTATGALGSSDGKKLTETIPIYGLFGGLRFFLGDVVLKGTAGIEKLPHDWPDTGIRDNNDTKKYLSLSIGFSRRHEECPPPPPPLQVVRDSVVHDTLPCPDCPKCHVLVDSLFWIFPRTEAQEDSLEPRYYPLLNEIATYMLGSEHISESAWIYSGADRVDTPEKNLRITNKRSRKIARFLITAGVDSTRIHTYGLGKYSPDVNDKGWPGYLVKHGLWKIYAGSGRPDPGLPNRRTMIFVGTPSN